MDEQTAAASVHRAESQKHVVLHRLSAVLSSGGGEFPALAQMTDSLIEGVDITV